MLWDRVQERFREKVKSLNNNKNVLALSNAIDSIPDEIKNYVVTEYVRRVQIVNSIFFYANRIKEKYQVADVIELKLLIGSLQRFLKKGLRKKKNAISNQNRNISNLSEMEL